MKIFYDKYFNSFDCIEDGNNPARYWSFSRDTGPVWYLIVYVTIGGRQVPDTVLILIGAPKLGVD